MSSGRSKNDWIREGLARRGFLQKDLAKAWGSQQASVSRFLNGEEMQDLPISKATTLAKMLGITTDQLAKGLGYNGHIVEPSIEAAASGSSLPLGTMNLLPIEPGVVRLEVRRDMSVSAAQQVIGVISMDAHPSMLNGSPDSITPRTQ